MAYYGPVYGPKSGPRDSQRQKVYDAEHAIPSGRNFRTVADIQAYVDKILESAWARRRWGNISVNVKPGHGHRSATGGYGDMQMPIWSRNERVVLHELAHNLAGGKEWHSPLFARVSHELYKHAFGADAATAHRKAMRDKRVRIGPALKLRSPERTPPPPPPEPTQKIFRIEIKRRGKPVELSSITSLSIDRAMDRAWMRTTGRSEIIGIRIWRGREVAPKPVRKAAKKRS